MNRVKTFFITWSCIVPLYLSLQTAFLGNETPYLTSYLSFCLCKTGFCIVLHAIGYLKVCTHTLMLTFSLFCFMAVFTCIPLSKGQVCWNSLGKYREGLRRNVLHSRLYLSDGATCSSARPVAFSQTCWQLFKECHSQELWLSVSKQKLIKSSGEWIALAIVVVCELPV